MKKKIDEYEEWLETIIENLGCKYILNANSFKLHDIDVDEFNKRKMLIQTEDLAYQFARSKYREFKSKDVKQVTRYKVIYKQFSMFHENNYDGMALFKEVIETDDIYHWIGKEICTSICKFSFVSYCETDEELTPSRVYIGRDKDDEQDENEYRREAMNEN